MIFELFERLSLRCHKGLEVLQPFFEVLIGGCRVPSQLLGLSALLRDCALEVFQPLPEVVVVGCWLGPLPRGVTSGRLFSLSLFLSLSLSLSLGLYIFSIY